MCQLLGMNCVNPTDFVFSFKGFCKRGGDTDIHADGWGLVFYEGRGIRAFHDPLAASKSPIAALVSNYPCKTLNMISHIRYATSGVCSLENVHPFQRELWGIPFVFAHNGDVPNYYQSQSQNPPSIVDIDVDVDVDVDTSDVKSNRNILYYTPVGSTDSEAIFCAILNALRNTFDSRPPMSVLYSYLHKLSMQIMNSHDLSKECVIFNFLLSAGEHFLFAFSWPGSRPGSKTWNGLHYVVREYPFHMATLKDCDVKLDFSQVTTEDDCVAVVATKPLTTDEQWVEFEKGQLLLFHKGRPYGSAEKCLELDPKLKDFNINITG